MPPVIVDLQQIDASALAPLLEAESRVWQQNLHWDFAASARVISTCLNEKRLSGLAMLIDDRIVGYCFYFHDAAKALIGNLFSVPEGEGPEADYLLEQVIKSLVRTRGVRRVEAQLPHFSFERMDPLFRAHGFQGYRRRFMLLPLRSYALPHGLSGPPRRAIAAAAGSVFGDFLIHPWKAEHDREVAQLLYEVYRGHVDALINDQYGHPAGTLKLSENILHHGACGEFLPAASCLATYRPTHKLAGALALTVVWPQRTAHIPQIAVAGEFQGLGLGTALMRASFAELANQGFQEVSLTVTDLNVGAVRLYERLGFRTLREFGAFVWNSP